MNQQLAFAAGVFSANEHELNQVGNLLHGDEALITADASYQQGGILRYAIFNRHFLYLLREI